MTALVPCLMVNLMSPVPVPKVFVTLGVTSASDEVEVPSETSERVTLMALAAFSHTLPVNWVLAAAVPVAVWAILSVPAAPAGIVSAVAVLLGAVLLVVVTVPEESDQAAFVKSSECLRRFW